MQIAHFSQQHVIQNPIIWALSPDNKCFDTGYVLSCLPFMSEECLKIHEQLELIKNLKLTPDFIINIKVIHMFSTLSCSCMKQQFVHILINLSLVFWKYFAYSIWDLYHTSIFHQCADKDLARRLSGLKQHPETGQLYNRDQWMREDVFIKNKENNDEEGEDEEDEKQVWLQGKHYYVQTLKKNVFIISYFSYMLFLFACRQGVKNFKRILLTTWCGHPRIWTKMLYIESTCTKIRCSDHWR